jgi:cytoskeletal protein CcmA (bactofilin family)
MKKIRIILLTLLVAVVPMVALIPVAHAANFKSGDNVATKSSDVIDHTLFIAGDNIKVNGTVKGDVFCAGQNITINAKVDGDVICAGMNIEIGGTIAGDVRAAGQVVVLKGSVTHNASLAGSNIRVDGSAKIGGDLQTGGSMTTINGSVARDIDAAGSTVTLNGTAGRDVQAATDNLRLDSNAKIDGAITYYSHNTVDKSASAHVSGEITRKEPQTKRHETNTNPFPGIFFSFFSLLLFAFVLLAVFPRRLSGLTDLALTKPGMTVLIGLAACIAAPAIILVSFMTVVGAFLGIVLLLAWVVILLLSGVLASYYIGRLALMKSPYNPFIAMLVGVIIISALLAVPVVNIITLIAIMLFGSGMVIRELFEKNATPSYTTLTHPKATKTRKTKETKSE